MNKSGKIIWAQWTMRNRPSQEPGTDYCLPGSRWEMMMRLARMGASDTLIKRRVPGIKDDTIRVLRRIADGTISGGANAGREDEPGKMVG